MARATVPPTAPPAMAPVLDVGLVDAALLAETVADPWLVTDVEEELGLYCMNSM